MRGDLRARFRLYGEGFGTKHALAQAVAEAVHHEVVRAHALLHDLWRHADHVRVSNLPALDHSYDGHARTQFARLRRHAHHADIRGFQGFQHIRGRSLHGARPKLFQKQSRIRGITVVQGGGDARGHSAAGFIGDQRHVFAGMHTKACFHGVARAGHQFRLRGTKLHLI